MFTLLGKVLQWFVSMCQSVLPHSPFADMTFQSIGQALGWFNWLVPMGDIVALFDLWLAAVALWYLYKFLYRQIGGVKAAVTGG